MPSTDKGANLETQDRTAGLKDVEFDSATKRFQVKDFSLSIWALIISNSIPVVGAIVFSWDVGLILTIYWMENIVLGFYNVIKMWMAKPDLEMVVAGKKSAGLLPGKIFIIGFFIFHFGMFCMVHGVFVMVMSQGMDSGFDLMPKSRYLIGPLMILALPIGLFSNLWSIYGLSLLIPITGIFISHGISFYENYLGKKEYETRSQSMQMFQPYARIVVLHVAIIAAGVPVMLLGSPMPLLVLLIVGKTLFDITLHRRSHDPSRAGGAGLFQRLISDRIRQNLPIEKKNDE